ncbi:unnamed protein product [Notodromas monacha]|uniref:G-protein coupled receptors family 1 profile domain-containing protein n=1 Tax=Notodromas monacha TaxID=399045 RepID=A0A7R9BSQ7_9CRUS|nr:unnamed protein product [Notodromas monacha]CAG0921037.1 unnamed protein product [Notodromas monacha]
MPLPRVYYSALTGPAIPGSVVPFDAPIEENVGGEPSFDSVEVNQNDGQFLSTLSSSSSTKAPFYSADYGHENDSYFYDDLNASMATTINYIMAFDGQMYPSRYSVARIAITSEKHCREYQQQQQPLYEQKLYPRAVDYMRTRTPKRAAAMIAIVWLVAAGISIPPLLGWSHPQQEGDFPSCELSEDIGYVLYSALGSFYIPSFIMVIVYIRIFFAARERARKNIQAKKNAMAAAAANKNKLSCKQSDDSDAAPPLPPSGQQTGGGNNRSSLRPKGSTTSQGSRHSQHSPPQSTGCLSLKRHRERSGSFEMRGLAGLTGKMGAQLGVAVMEQLSMPSNNLQEIADAISITGEFSEFDASSSTDLGYAAYCSSVIKPMRHKFKALKSIFSRRRADVPQEDHVELSKLAAANRPKASMMASFMRDPEKEKRRIARQKEKRATFVLGLIVGAFILCWLPFFLLYVIQAICHESCHIQEWGFATAFWLGYANSAFNPVIYTIFNKDFRNAFHKILCK